MVIFNSYVKLPEGTMVFKPWKIALQTSQLPSAPATRRAKQLAPAGSAALSAAKTRRTVAVKDGRSWEYGAPWEGREPWKKGMETGENMGLMWVYRV